MNVIIFAILWIIFTILGEWGASWIITNYPMVGSLQGKITDEAIFFLLKATIPIFIFVTLWIVFSVIRFRARPGEEGPGPNQAKDNWRFSWTWFALSAIINIVFIIHPGITGLDKLWGQEKVPHPLVVNVTAEQWKWSFDYPKYGIKNSPILMLPVNKEDEFILKTKDVMHSFWIPAFRVKKAVMPGETRTLYMKPDVISNTKSNPLMRVQCAQVCGIGHAEMRAVVKVVSQTDFEKWAKQHANKNMASGM